MKIRDVTKNTTHEIPKDILPEAYRQGVEVNVKPGENRLDFDLKSGG